MISDVLKQKFNFASKYFEQVLEGHKKFPQSIVFEGLDIFGQYFFSLELARILNCKNSGDTQCKCLNCSWIRDNKHPAVITVSQIDFRPSDDKTGNSNINVAQSREITKILSQSSDYHRVFIFLSAGRGELEHHTKKQFEEYSSLNFALPQEKWIPSWLNRKIFDDEAPNALLKCVEEPPQNTTFIFLTKNREDLISTIVSRSQVFKLPSEKFSFNLEEIAKMFEKYPHINLNDAFEISKKMQDMAQGDFNLQEILNTLEQYFGELLKNNPENSKILNDIKLISTAKKRLKAFISPKNTFDSLLADIAEY